MSSSTSISNFPRPLPGIGYAMNLREYSMNALLLDTDPNDNFAMRGSKILASTVLRCTSYSVPYIRYASWPYMMVASQYVNMGLAAIKGAYSGYSYYQGYTENDENKKEQAKKIAYQAAAHGLFAYADNLISYYLSAREVVPIITAYVGVGALTDLLGKSKQIHNKWFNNENRSVEDDRDLELGYASESDEYDSGSESEEFNGEIRDVSTYGLESEIEARLELESEEDPVDFGVGTDWDDMESLCFSDDDEEPVNTLEASVGTPSSFWKHGYGSRSLDNSLNRSQSLNGSNPSTKKVGNSNHHPSRKRSGGTGPYRRKLRSYSGSEKPNYTK